ncbi:filamentous hemagglutinin N-terminal domain-containing protein [Acaryochloris marina]|uniref:filamentous hemagglutinin N-terminal domain-containing protein n=1 Tax=Acaryochloris marina TaxID=155978 RepID=UPI0021C4BB66|nr:filamentous hemagglutinin N-terminal domain-containing protein [Acaryochloris marina]
MNQSILLTSALAIWSVLLTPGLAQVSADRTLGNENSVIEQQRNRILIQGGATRGNSLFHSLKDLSIGTGQEVYFSNPNNINIILTRITGRNPSNINGTLGVLGDADLFLMNPSGIHFGPNASLKLDGSFIATTGDSFVFEDGKEFSARNPQPAPELKISVPTGIQFNGNSGGISIRGNSTDNIINLSADNQNISSGKTFALISNGLSINLGNIKLPSGNIELISLGKGLVKVNLRQSSFQFFSTSNTESANINLERSYISTVPTNFFDISSRNDIKIQGKNIFLERTNINTSSFESGGNIRIFSKNLTLNNSLIKSESNGSGGNMNFEISNLFLLKKNSDIISSNGNTNNGARDGIKINSNLLVAIDNSSIKVTEFSSANLTITAKGILISEDSDISANSFNINGFININPPTKIRENPEFIDKTHKIVKGCRAGQSLGGSTFVNVGRGGVPLGPQHIQTPPSIWQDLRTLPISFPKLYSSNVQEKSTFSKYETSSQSSDSTSTSNIVEAQGWFQDKQGRIVLTANSSKLMAYDPGQPVGNC